MLTFQKGHIVLGIVGIFIPFLWLIGAIIPAKPDSRYAQQENMRYQTR
jgi:primosomal protein N'